MFVGCSNWKKGYKGYSPSIGKVIISKYATFHEAMTPTTPETIHKGEYSEEIPSIVEKNNQLDINESGNYFGL